MKTKLHKLLVGGGAKLVVLSVLFVNSVSADSASDARIQAYRANKLIPQNIVLPTSTGAADSDKVVVFNSGTLVWNNDTAKNAPLYNLMAKYGEWTLQDFIDAFGDTGRDDRDLPYGWAYDITEKQKEMRNYLSEIATGRIISPEISAQAAKDYLQEQFDYLMANMYTTLAYFPCETISFVGCSFYDYKDLSTCTGITAEKFLQATCYGSTYNPLPKIVFTGEEDFSKIELAGADLSNLVGVTATQIASAKSISGTILPAITFDGTEVFTGSVAGTDFSKCTGLTGKQISANGQSFSRIKATNVVFDGTERIRDLGNTDITTWTGITSQQISQVYGVNSMRITSQQYAEWHDALVERFPNKTIFVDGVPTKIQ